MTGSSSSNAPASIKPATGKLGILTPGLGAVATTFMAGVESVRRGLSQPIGSLTQMATIRLGKRTENRSPLIKDFVPLAGLDDLVFGAWDPIPDDAHQAAIKAGVLTPGDQASVGDFLRIRLPISRVGLHAARGRHAGGVVGRDRHILGGHRLRDGRRWK